MWQVIAAVLCISFPAQLNKQIAFFPWFIKDFSAKIGAVSLVFGNGETLKAPTLLINSSYRNENICAIICCTITIYYLFRCPWYLNRKSIFLYWNKSSR